MPVRSAPKVRESSKEREPAEREPAEREPAFRAADGTGLQAGLFLLALLPRVAYLLLFKPPFETTYWALADSLLRSRSLALDGVRVTDFEPLYPIFLAICRAITGDRALIVQLLQIAASSLGAVYLYRLALKLSRDARVAVTGALLFAFHPLLVRQAGAASDLALVTTLLVVFAYACVSIDGLAGAVIAGVWLGLAVLTRAMVLPLLACGVFVLLADGRREYAAAFACSALLLCAPLALRNHAVNGSWWPTRSGLNLFIGNSPYTGALVPDYDADLLVAPAYALFNRERPDLLPSAPENAEAVDAFLTRRAFRYMTDHPLATLGRKALNVLYFLSPRLVPFNIAGADTRAVIGAAGEVVVENSVSRPRVEVIAHAVAASFVLPAAVVGVYIRRRHLRQDAILWAVVATFIVVNAVYVPATRYAAPMTFVLLFYAAVALARVHRSGPTGQAPRFKTHAAIRRDRTPS
jgi:4-amino-4-deoxy-L-arabinose transferase-like glycosyltransferase